MERHKGFDLSWACGHGQHALDEHDRDTQHSRWHSFLSPIDKGSHNPRYIKFMN